MSMQKPRWPVEGGCRCGRVRFRLTGPPLIEMACHCRGCQRMSASAFSTTLIMASAHFALLQGDTEVGGIHGDQVHHHHCPWCKGWVYTKAVAAPDSINVRATLLDDPSWFAPWAETQTAEKLAWAVTGAARSFARFPDASAFGSLLADYQAERG
jgi:hypothetical protein